MSDSIDSQSSHQRTSRSMAEDMADFIDKWLGNPFSRWILKYCTKRCRKCGRRIELALRKYVEEDVDLCIECSVAYRLVKMILDTIMNRINVSKQEFISNLRDPMWRKGLSSVLEGIAKYGPTKPFTAYAPFLIVWNFTNACNLKCKHCYQSAGTSSFDELTTEEALEAVDKMADAGVAYIAFSGGEPLVRKDLFDVIDRIREREMAFSLATNGTLLTKKIVKKLKEYNCLYIQISLDGAKRWTHDSFRGGKSFMRVINGIKNAVESGITVGVATTVTKFNYNEVYDIIELAEELGVNIFMYYNFIPTGRGKDIVNLDISPEERERLLRYMASQIGKRKISLLSTAPQYSRISIACGSLSLTHFDTIGPQSKDLAFLAEFVGGCGTGRLYCALQPNGDITPCVFIPIVLGNIRKDDLLNIWHDSEVLKKIRARDEFIGCSNCKYINICGGCRARAYSYFGDLQGPDPGCIINNKYWRMLEKQVTREVHA